MSSQHFIQVLVKLGLTATEAKIFWALSSVGTLTARMISENAGIAREVVYQVMPTLQEKGLVETILTMPQMYRAVPTEDAFGTLLRRNIEEHKKMQREIKECIRTLKKVRVEPVNDCPQITILPQGKALRSKISGSLKTAQESVDAIISWQKFQKWYDLYLREEIREARKRSLKLHILISEKSNLDIRHAALSSPVFALPQSEYPEFRAATNIDLINLVVFDHQRVFVDVSSNGGIAKSPFMFSNNPNLTPLITNYFQSNWDKALPIQSSK